MDSIKPNILNLGGLVLRLGGLVEAQAELRQELKVIKLAPGSGKTGVFLQAGLLSLKAPRVDDTVLINDAVGLELYAHTATLSFARIPVDAEHLAQIERIRTIRRVLRLISARIRLILRRTASKSTSLTFLTSISWHLVHGCHPPALGLHRISFNWRPGLRFLTA